MHTTKIIKCLTLAASLAAGIAVVASSQGAFAGQSIQTVDHRTNPTGAGPNRSGKTGPDPGVPTVKATVHQNGTRPGDIQGCVSCTPTSEQVRTSQDMQPHDHRTNPTGAGANRSNVQGPPIQRDEQGRAIVVNYYNPHEHVDLGLDKNGKVIKSDYTISEKIYQRMNKDGSIDKIQVIIDQHGSETTRILRHSVPKPHQANLGGNCLFGVCW